MCRIRPVRFSVIYWSDNGTSKCRRAQKTLTWNLSALDMPYRSMNHASMTRPRPVKMLLTAINCWVNSVISNPRLEAGTLVPPEVAENIVASRLRMIESAWLHLDCEVHVPS
jgi:hypothetical protein